MRGLFGGQRLSIVTGTPAKDMSHSLSPFLLVVTSREGTGTRHLGKKNAA